jgi:hypothetical protein
MEYNIEISYDIFNGHNRFQTKNDIINLINMSFCKDVTSYYDMEKYHNYKRNHCVYTIIFENEDVEKCINFLYMVKKNKNINLECIYFSDITTNLLYASKYYLEYILDNKDISKKDVLRNNIHNELIGKLLDKNYFNLKL